MIQQNFTTDLPITITLASLGNNAFATSSSIDNTVASNKFLSADIQLTIKTGASGVSGTVSVYLIRSADNGTTYDDANANAQVLGVFTVNSNATTYVFSSDTSSVGYLPAKWKLAVQNQSGTSFDSNSANFSVSYTGKKLETV